MNNLGVSYRVPDGIKGGRKKPVCVFKIKRNICGAKLAQMNALFLEQGRLQRGLYPEGTKIWEWED